MTTLALSACGPATPGSPPAAVLTTPPDATTAPATAPTIAPATAPTTAPASAATVAPAAAAAAAAATKVNANTASIPELQRAFEANGIPNAARWAREVDEYRPYPTNDPALGKLRSELAKYNPSTDVLQKILASLTL